MTYRFPGSLHIDFYIDFDFYIELCYFLSSIIIILTPFRMSLFGAAHGWGAKKAPPP